MSSDGPTFAARPARARARGLQPAPPAGLVRPELSIEVEAVAYVAR
jgi:hypothetical protein